METRKRTSMGKQPDEFPPNSPKSRKSSPAPHVRLSEDTGESSVDMDAVQCAVMALSHWNERNRYLKRPEYKYKLVKALGYKRKDDPILYHCNFVARAKTGGEKVFFAELQNSEDFTKDGKSPAIGCSISCILGPLGFEAVALGRRYCYMCDNAQIHHPEGMYFLYSGEFERRRRPFRRNEDTSYDAKNTIKDQPPPLHDLFKWAALALAQFNEKCSLEQIPEYQLNCIKGAMRNLHPYIVHFNFLAQQNFGRPELFFTEIVKDKGTVSCNHVCILGFVGTKTGLNGCKMCEDFPERVQHPENVEYANCFKEEREKYIASLRVERIRRELKHLVFRH